MIVVKLGGSLYNSPELKHWLNTLATQAKQQTIVIVPGGGPFANQVRLSQDIHHFDDSCAHHMALLAMNQFGLLLSAIEAKCQLFHFPNDNLNSTPDGLSVWLPERQLLTEASIQHSWSITSDSLALWLANELDAEQLVIIKQVNTSNNRSITKLSELQIIDDGFPQLYSQIPVASQLMNAHDYDQFSERLNKLTSFQLYL